MSQPTPEMAGVWMLSPPVQVTTEDVNGSSSLTLDPSIFSATAFHSQEEDEVFAGPEFSYLQPSSFHVAHYRTPSSSFTFSAPFPPLNRSEAASSSLLGALSVSEDTSMDVQADGGWSTYAESNRTQMDQTEQVREELFSMALVIR